MAEPVSGAILQVETPESVAFDFELADAGSRGLAIVLDTLILVLILLAEMVVGAAIAFLVYRVAPERFRSAVNWVAAGLISVAFLTSWGYFVVGEVVAGGRTPGKRALGLRVLRDDGSRVGLADSMIRNVLRIVDILPGNYAVGMVSVLVSARRKRLGDMAAGTVVVRDASDVVIDMDPGSRPEAEALAREYLLRRDDLSPEGRQQVAVAVLGALGETAGPDWDEPTIAGRLADITGSR